MFFFNSRTIAILIHTDKFFGAGPKVSIIRTTVRRVYDDTRKKFEKQEFHLISSSQPKEQKNNIPASGVETTHSDSISTFYTSGATWNW